MMYGISSSFKRLWPNAEAIKVILEAALSLSEGLSLLSSSIYTVQSS